VRRASGGLAGGLPVATADVEHPVGHADGRGLEERAVVAFEARVENSCAASTGPLPAIGSRPPAVTCATRWANHLPSRDESIA
jgi:hypothetical protein